MCGLAGAILKDTDRSGVEYKLIGRNMTLLLNEASSRGKHATGIVSLQRDGNFKLHKKDLSAEKLTVSTEYLNVIDKIDETTGAVIGHTRYATKGSPQKNRNNHPIRAGRIIGTHNGSVYNDDKLFRKFNLQRYAQVDSEVLFRLIQKAPDAETFRTELLPEVNGIVTMVWADVEKPEHVYIMKGNNPLEMVYVKEYETLFYASTRDMLERALMKEALLGYTMEYFDIKDYRMLRINTTTLKVEMKQVEFATNRPQVTGYGNTVSGFVPRYSYTDYLNKGTVKSNKPKPVLSDAGKGTTKPKPKNGGKAKAQATKDQIKLHFSPAHSSGSGFKCNRCQVEFRIPSGSNTALKKAIKRHKKRCTAYNRKGSKKS